MSELREYQVTAVDSVKTWVKYKDTPCIVDVATGGGKTHIINALVEYFYTLNQRVCVLAHRKELLEQTGQKLSVPFGYYSASVGGKDTKSSVIIAGVQSIFNKEFDKFDVVIVDECHHMPNSAELGQYWQFIGKHQPCKLIGLTATPYRLAGGKLAWGEIVYKADYKMLLDLGFLTKIVNKSKDAPDLSSVGLVAGEYSEGLLATVMEDPELIASAIKNIIAYGDGRESILIFCVNVAHAVILTKQMKENGLQSATLHSGTTQGEREQMLVDFKSGALRHLVNCEILLEGFDAPNVDMIVCLRPTKSKALWEQMLGRGVRKHEGKEDCFLLDMAGNLMEHGGLGSPLHQKAKGEAPKVNGKICPQCETFVEPVSVRVCDQCQYHWPPPESPLASHGHEANTSSGAIFEPMVKYTVKNVVYREHTNQKNGKKSFRIDYVCNTKYGSISEWISPHSENEFARSKAKQFFKERGYDCYGDTKDYSVEDLLFHALTLKKPSVIHVDHSEKFPRIKRYEYASRESDTESLDSPLSDDEIPW